MKIQELRLGNLVSELVLGIVTISVIKPDTVWVTAKHMRTDGLIENAQYHLDISSIEPVVLTEEWLLKFGFKQEVHNNNKLNWWNLPKGNNYQAHHLMKMQNSWTWFIDFDDCDADNDCHLVKGFDYVHELQNICHALTEYELEIK